MERHCTARCKEGPNPESQRNATLHVWVEKMSTKETRQDWPEGWEETTCGII